MERGKALELLKEATNEIPRLATLSWDNQEFKLWRDKILDILEVSFGRNSTEYERFSQAFPRTKRAGGQEEYYLKELEMRETALKSIIRKYEILGFEEEQTANTELKDTIQLPIQLFEAMQFHPKIINASRALFEDGHYAQAIFEACKAVENFVQDKSGLTLYGTNLMDTVFNEENPIIKVPEAGHYYKDVQRGFKHLFVGAAQAIRNPKAHKEIIQKDPYITLQYLGFFSFLLKRIDYWDAGVS